MINKGIPRSEAEKIVNKKKTALEVENHTKNYNHAVEVARILQMPYMNIHTPLDELGRQILSDKIESAVGEESKVKDVVATLKELHEFNNASTEIQLRLGNLQNLAGNVMVSHGAGTNGGYEIAKTYFKYGISTLIYIHISSRDLEKMKSDNIGNLIITGHISSDSVGINPFISKLEKRGITVTRLGIISSEPQ